MNDGGTTLPLLFFALFGRRRAKRQDPRQGGPDAVEDLFQDIVDFTDPEQPTGAEKKADERQADNSRCRDRPRRGAHIDAGRDQPFKPLEDESQPRADDDDF